MYYKLYVYDINSNVDKNFFQPNFLGTICVAAVGACTYGVMLLILKEPMVCNILDAIMGKLCRK